MSVNKYPPIQIVYNEELGVHDVIVPLEDVVVVRSSRLEKVCDKYIGAKIMYVGLFIVLYIVASIAIFGVCIDAIFKFIV